MAFGITNNQNGFVAKVSSNGDLLWMKMLGGLLTTTFQRVISTDDGGVLVTGNTTGYGEGSFDIILCKLSASGNLEFTKLYGSNSYEGSLDFQKVASGGYAISGESSAFGAGLRDFLFFTIQDDF